MIGTETITNGIETFLARAIEWANQQPLLQHETKVVGVLYENNGEIYYAAVTLNTDAQISRYLVDEPLKKIITSLLENIS